MWSAHCNGEASRVHKSAHIQNGRNASRLSYMCASSRRTSIEHQALSKRTHTETATASVSSHQETEDATAAVQHWIKTTWTGTVLHPFWLLLLKTNRLWFARCSQPKAFADRLNIAWVINIEEQWCVRRCLHKHECTICMKMKYAFKAFSHNNDPLDLPTFCLLVANQLCAV